MDDLKKQLVDMINEEVNNPLLGRKFSKPNPKHLTEKVEKIAPPNAQPIQEDVTSNRPRMSLTEPKRVERRPAYFDNLLEQTSRQITAQVDKPEETPLSEVTTERRIKKLEEDFINVLARGTPNTLVNGLGASFSDTGGGTTWLWDLDDVDIGTPMNGQYPIVNNGDAILYDETTNTWKPGSPGGTYTLPVATDTRLGGIKTGTDFVTDADGNLSLSTDVTLPGDLVPATDSTSDIGDDSHYLQYLYTDNLVQRDTQSGDKVILTIRNNQIILTDATQEITTSVDLGGTTPDPGSLENVYLDGSGKYSVGVAGTGGLNTNGLVTQEFINSPGQFFVINDIDGGVFGPGDRQAFGLIRETLYDGTDLDGGPALWSGGSSGGWSMGPTWFYTGGNPYIWTFYAFPAQTPGGAGEGLNGAMGGQTSQRLWWGLCTKADVGKKIRLGIADGASSDQAGANYTNRLILQLYVSQEMLDHPDAGSDLPGVVITNGAGWYTAFATTGEYENMGSFPDGVDKGYRFRWSTFGRTSLSQLPYVSGVSNNDQIASASGLSYYIVYDPTAADTAAANVVLATGTTSANNAFFPSVPVKLLQFNDPYESFTTPAAQVFDLKYTETGSVQQSPIFHNYPISTTEEIIESSLNASGVQKLRREVCQEILDAVTGYYLIRDLNNTDRAAASAYWSDILTVALAGQLQSVYDLTLAKTADPLAPQELLDAVLETCEKWINTFPVAGSGQTLFFNL